MFFALSDSSLAGIYSEVVCEDYEVNLHIFHRTTLSQLPLFYHRELKVRIVLKVSPTKAWGKYS